MLGFDAIIIMIMPSILEILGEGRIAIRFDIYMDNTKNK